MVSSIFGGPDPPAPDPGIEAARQREEQRAEQLKKEKEDREAEEADARNRGLRGRRSLLTGSELGYEDTFA